MSKLGPISHFLSPVSCDSLVLQGLRCEWGTGVLNVVLSLSLSHTGHWKFNMAPHGKDLSEDLKKIFVALHKDVVGYNTIAKTLKRSCSTVAKTIQRFNKTGSTQNRPRHGQPKKLSARAQSHIQRLCLGNRRMSAASIAAEVEGVGGQPVNDHTPWPYACQWPYSGLRPYAAHCIKLVCMAVIPEGRITGTCPVVWWDQEKTYLVQMVSSVCGCN